MVIHGNIHGNAQRGLRRHHTRATDTAHPVTGHGVDVPRGHRLPIKRPSRRSGHCDLIAVLLGNYQIAGTIRRHTAR